MTKNDTENRKVLNFIADINSTLEEISVYLGKKHKIHLTLLNNIKSNYSIIALKKKSDLIMKIINKNFISPSIIDNDYFRRLRNFIFSDLSIFVDMFNLFFNKLLSKYKTNFFGKDKWEDENPITLLSASYFLLNLNFRNLRNIVNRYFNLGFEEHSELLIKKDDDKIWDTSKMNFKEFISDIKKIKEYAEEILDEIDIEEFKTNMLMKLQISEFIKNAIRHGNKLDKTKKVKVWYDINQDYAKLIIEDEGDGFKGIEEWNRFNKLRNKYIKAQDIGNVLKYASYRTNASMENDGGNFLFSALEYWDSGVIFNEKRNKVVVIKYFY